MSKYYLPKSQYSLLNSRKDHRANYGYKHLVTDKTSKEELSALAGLAALPFAVAAAPFAIAGKVLLGSKKNKKKNKK